MTDQPKWRQFEELVAKIQADLAPYATVRHNDKIEGRLTGAKRQVDVSIRQTVGPHQLLVAIDCKDLNRPADVKDVEEVIGLAQDVGANKTAIVSALGYTDAALKRGKQAGLDLLRLVDTSQHNWKTLVTIPVLVQHTRLESFSFTLSCLEPKPWSIPAVDVRLIEIVSRNGELIGLLGDLLATGWNDERFPMEPGRHEGVPITADGYINGPAGPVATGLSATLSVSCTLYFGNLPLQEVSGFVDEGRGVLISRGFTTSAIDIVDVQENWMVVEREEDLAVRPVLRMESHSYIPVSHDLNDPSDPAT